MTSETNCSNCSQSHGPDDMFCENCGYDFISGTLPPDLVGVPGPSSATPNGDGETESEADLEVEGNGEPENGAAGNNPDEPDADASESPGGSSGTSQAEAAGNEDAADAPGPDEGGPSGDDEATGEVERIRIEISIDRAFFDEVVNEGEIEFPGDAEPSQIVEIAGDEIYIGRASESRAIHPDIDIAELTNDQAVSSRHAVIRVVNKDNLQLIDIGSTNGTFIESPSSDAIEEGSPIDLARGVPFFVGAWTRLTVLADE